MGDLFLVKYLSALSTIVVAALVLPIQGIFFLWPLIAGPVVKSTLSVWIIVSIFVTMLGTISFNIKRDKSTKLQSYNILQSFQKKSTEEAERQPLIN